MTFDHRLSGVHTDAVVNISAADSCLTELAHRIQALSVQRYGRDRSTLLVGADAAICETQLRLLKFAQAESPVLITGETGTGKELFARALSLLSPRRERPFLSVNCAQYHDGHLVASELFGHRRGSFTGAVADHAGLFEDADRGMLFLDEVGELPPGAQAILLRVLGEGELVRVGDTRPRRVDVRVLAATSRDLEAQVESGVFREDLYYRLRFLRLRVPPLRERGRDWHLLLQHFLSALNSQYGTRKHFSRVAIEALERYHWPGNVRELKSLVDLAFFASAGDIIEPSSFAGEMRCLASRVDPAPPPLTTMLRQPPDDGHARDRYERMRARGESFWEVVYAPFMERELNRAEVRSVVAMGLTEALGSYKRLLTLFGIESSAYLKFMDFLRHHRLKPEWPELERRE